MTQNDFNHFLSGIDALSPDQMQQLIRKLQSKMATSGKQATPAPEDAEESAYDLAHRAGVIGCIKGEPGTPTDLSTNPKHMEGFGRD